MSSLCPACASTHIARVMTHDTGRRRAAQQDMRCDSCGHLWTKPHTNLWHSMAGTSAAWALVIMIAGSVPLVLSKRDALVRHLPQLAPAFRLIGLPVNLRGLTFAGLTTRISEDHGQKILTIEGTIASVAKTSKSVPPMLISLRGTDGRELYHWTTQAGQSQIEPGKSLIFRTRLASPPDNAQIAQVNFTNAESIVLR